MTEVGLKVAVGAHDLRSGRDLNFMISRLVLHPSYRCNSYHDDVALLELVEPVVWSAGVLPACFPSRDIPSLADREVTVAGWGWTDENYSKGKITRRYFIASGQANPDQKTLSFYFFYIIYLLYKKRYWNKQKRLEGSNELNVFA